MSTLAKPNYAASHGILTIAEILSWAALPAGAIAGMAIGDIANSGAAGFGFGAIIATTGVLGVAMTTVAKASLHTSETAFAILEHIRVVSPAPAPAAEAADPKTPPSTLGWTTKTIKGRSGSVVLTVDESGIINAPTSFGSKQFRTEEEAVAYFA